MIKTVGLKVAAGTQCGSIGCVLITAAFYGTYWSPQPQFDQTEQMHLMLYTIMYGAFYGVVFGTWVAFQRKILSSSIGALVFGMIGVFTTGPISEMISLRPNNALCLGVLAAHTIVGSLLGSLLIPEWWKKKSAQADTGSN